MALFLPSKFQQDIQGRNTNLVPIVVIETAIRSDFPEHNINLSTVSMSMRHIRYHNFSTSYNDPLPFLPLLLNVPSVKESIDLDKRKHKINTITLNLSNMPYEGKRLSDRIAESDKITDTLKNTRVSIQWVSPQVEYYSTFQYYYISANNKGIYYDVYSNKSEGDSGYSFTEKMAFMAYSGVCTKYTHDDTKVTLTIEDRTELDFHQDLPIQNDTNWLSTNTSVPEKYRGKPKPMVYGYVDKSPCVLDANGQIVIDSKPINAIVKLGHETFGTYEPLYMASGDSIVSVAKKVEKNLGSVIEGGIDNEEEVDTVAVVGKSQWSHNNNDDNEPADNIIQLNIANELITNNVLQCDVFHKASSVYLSKDTPTSESDVNILTDEEISNLNNNDYNTGTNINVTESFTAFANQNVKNLHYNYFELKIATKPSVSDMLGSKGIAIAINTHKLPIPHGVTGHASAIYLYPIELEAGSSDFYTDTILIGSPFSLKESSPTLTDYDYDLTKLFGFSSEDGISGYDYGVGGTPKDIDIKFAAESNGISVGQNLRIPALFFYDYGGFGDHVDGVNNGEYIIRFRLHSNVNESEDYDYASSLTLENANINEIDIRSYLDIENIYQKQFFTTVRGRIGNNSANSYLRQPTEIITNIIREVKNDPDYEPERRALDSGYENGFSGFINDFTVHKKIGSKKLIENILATSPFIGRFANNGKFVFNEIPKRGGTPLYTIKEEDVINFSFIKTEDIFTKVILKSKINYLTDEFENTTEVNVNNLFSYFDQSTTPVTQVKLYDYAYYGLLDDDSQSTLIVDDDRGKYIRNKDAAEKLAYWLLSYYANSHLKLKVDLPLNYLNAEVGDIINFNKLIQGIKPYGINYVKDGEEINGQVIFKTFIITSTVKTLDKITIECVQNHALYTQECSVGFDCNGICGGTAFLDVCGICSVPELGEGETDVANCEVCPEEAIDCLGVCGGTAVRDACGVCEGTCDGTPTGDCDYECGCADIPEGFCDCNGNVEDCNGVCGGEAYVDECGNCVGGTTDEEPCPDDCLGEAGGDATYDICSFCTPSDWDVNQCWSEVFIKINGNNNLHLKQIVVTFDEGYQYNESHFPQLREDGGSIYEPYIQQPPNATWQQENAGGEETWGGYQLLEGFQVVIDPEFAVGDGQILVDMITGYNSPRSLAFTDKDAYEWIDSDTGAHIEYEKVSVKAGFRKFNSNNRYMIFRLPDYKYSVYNIYNEFTQLSINKVELFHSTGGTSEVALHDLTTSEGESCVSVETIQEEVSWALNEGTKINKHIINITIPDEYAYGSPAIGDINNDGNFNILDIVTLSNRVIADNPYTASGDMNGDGSLNVLDVVILANCVLNATCTGEVE